MSRITIERSKRWHLWIVRKNDIDGADDAEVDDDVDEGGMDTA